MLYEIRFEEFDSRLGVDSTCVENVLRGLPPGVQDFSLVARMPFDINAVVVRNPPERDVVELTAKARKITLLRCSTGLPGGDIGVSCSPDGERVPVETINIEFRNYHDEYTNRGIVWVRPGTSSNMFFIIRASALATVGLVTEIVRQAEEAMKKQLLDRFAGG